MIKEQKVIQVWEIRCLSQNQQRALFMRINVMLLILTFSSITDDKVAAGTGVLLLCEDTAPGVELSRGSGSHYKHLTSISTIKRSFMIFIH